MKKLFCLALAFLALVSTNVLNAQDIATTLIEDGGSGPYKAIMATDESLQTHTIFKPINLEPFGRRQLLPVLVWGNGACANSPFEHYRFLNEIASNGFLVIAIAATAPSPNSSSTPSTGPSPRTPIRTASTIRRSTSTT